MDDFASSSTEDVQSWLANKGFSSDVQKAFQEEDMDGEAVVQAFAACSGPDCLKDVLPKYGTRIKVYNALKVVIGATISKEAADYLSDDGSFGFSPALSHRRKRSAVMDDVSDYAFSPSMSSHGRRYSSGRESDADGSTYPLSPRSTGGRSLSSRSPTPIRKDMSPTTGNVPDPFPIPKFRDATQQNLEKGRLANDDRKYIVRVLATMLCTHVTRPSMADCKVVAMSLLKKYEFLKEYYSWQQFIYTRCQNTNRKPPAAGGSPKPSSPKRQKLDDNHAYPSLACVVEDDTAHARNMEQLEVELAKPKPRLDVVHSLMTETFTRRRKWTLEQKTVNAVVEKYPFLQKPIHVNHEMALVMQLGNPRQQFDDSWWTWEEAIIKYAAATVNKPKQLTIVLKDKDSSDQETKTCTALKCLAFFLTTKTRNKKEEICEKAVIPFIMMEVPRGTPAGEAVDRTNDFPHILRFYDVDPEVPTQYFIAVEQQLVLECRSILSAMFNLLAVHYIFNIQYHPRVRDVLFLLQEKVLQVEDPTFKKSAMYSNVSAAIQCFL